LQFPEFDRPPSTDFTRAFPSRGKQFLPYR
jgi:hypothetical protein